MKTGAILNNEIFVIGVKNEDVNLVHTIKDIKSRGYSICLISHRPLLVDIQKSVDYFIYEGGVKEAPIEHLVNIANAVDLLRNKPQFKYIHYRDVDLTYDFDIYMHMFDTMKGLDRKAMFVHYQDSKYRTDLFSVDIRWYDSVIPRVQSWGEYAALSYSDDLILEHWFSEQVDEGSSKAEIVFLPSLNVEVKCLVF